MPNSLGQVREILKTGRNQNDKLCEGKRQELLLYIALRTWMISEYYPERKQGGAGLELRNVRISNSLLHFKLNVKLRKSGLLLRL